MISILKYQYKLFIFLFCISILPLTLVYLYLPGEFDKSYYFFLTLLVGLRFSFFKGGLYLEKVRSNMRDVLAKEMGRIPSTNEIVKRVDDVVKSRDYAFGVSAVLVILITALFGKL